MNPMTLVLLAHSFYSGACCGGQDCKPVSCDDITPFMGGWVYRHEIVFEREKLKISPDGNCHVCISMVMPPHGVCIYLPPET